MSARDERVGIALLLAAACSTDSTQLDQNVGAPDASGDAVTDLLCPLSAGGIGPPAIPHTASSSDQSAFDEFSWQSLLALGGAQANGSNPPLWTQWSSTSSFLDLVAEWSRNGSVASEFPAFGAQHYPATCLDYCAQQGIDCSDYQTIEQVGKINDSIFEADGTGLSSNPVIAANGTFLRYEIRFNQSMYESVRSNALYDVRTLTSSGANVACGGAESEGAMNIKLAWMDMKDMDTAKFHTEERLVYTAPEANGTGVATCSLVTVGLVGLHVAHKTLEQQNWVWSTFEHNDNAPDCGAFTSQATNTSCPPPPSTSYNFYSSTCQAEGAGPCQTCNARPASNQATATCQGGFCVDQAPATNGGFSRLCRQVPVTSDGPYASAYAWNSACQRALGESVWANYMLISTQWFDWAQSDAPSEPTECSDVAATLGSVPQADTHRGDFRPQVPDNGQSSDRPLLANTSMESYERSNCMGCHGKAALTNTTYSGGAGQLPPQGSSGPPVSQYEFTDMSWWLAVEVPALTPDVCAGQSFADNDAAQAGCPSVCTTQSPALSFTGSWTNAAANVEAAGCSAGQSVCGCTAM